MTNFTHLRAIFHSYRNHRLDVRLESITGFYMSEIMAFNELNNFLQLKIPFSSQNTNIFLFLQQNKINE